MTDFIILYFLQQEEKVGRGRKKEVTGFVVSPTK